MSGVTNIIAEIEGGPAGPDVGAFFEVDGTLIAGSTANVFHHESAESRQGKTDEELEELGQRLFVQRIAGMVYPEGRELVAAHLGRGHTVALTSSATRNQVAPLAADLGVEHLLCAPPRVAAVSEFAIDRAIDLARSYGYTSGLADLPFLELVGRPHALNPEPGLSRVADERGWPAARLSGRGRPSIIDLARTGAAVAGLGTAAALGVGLGLVSASRRKGANFGFPVGSDAALAIAGVRLRVTGQQHLWSDRPAVFMFNHQSSMDVPIVASLVRRDFTAVAKKETARDPRFMLVGYLIDAAYVDRGNTSQARNALAPAVERLRNGVSIAIAPEGTRSPTHRLGSFKKGAFHLALQAGVPIVPIVIRNSGDVMWRGSLVIRPGTVDVAVREPIPTAGWTAGALDSRVADVRQRFLETLEQWPDKP